MGEAANAHAMKDGVHTATLGHTITSTMAQTARKHMTTEQTGWPEPQVTAQDQSPRQQQIRRMWHQVKTTQGRVSSSPVARTRWGMTR